MMNRKMALTGMALWMAALAGFVLPEAWADLARTAGLAGGQYGSEDFTNLEHFSLLDGLERTWSESDEYGRQWSAEWEGFIVAPADGQISFLAETNRSLQISIVGKKVVGVKEGKASGSIVMVKGKEYPIKVTYAHYGKSYDSHFRVTWSWAGQQEVSIPAANLLHTADQEQKWAQKAQQVEDEDEDNDDDGDGDDNDEDEGAVAGLSVILAQEVGSSQTNMPGLVGVICEGADFDRPASIDIIKHANHNWTGGPGNWSGYWQGYIEAPYTGEVRFIAEVDNGIKLAVDKQIIIDGLGRRKARVGSVSMVKGRKYPMYLWYFQDGDPSYLRLYWSWAGQDKTIVDESAFSYSPADTKFALGMLPGDFWSDEETPFNFDGTGSEPLDLAYQDARLLPVVGVENYQVFRSNREHADVYTGGLRNTYIHAPMLCYWNNKYYLEFLAAPVNEHDENTETLITSSVDGKNWATPKIIFPGFQPQGDRHKTITHQRMGFYVSKNNRLLVLAFYGRHPSPNEGNGLGRVVREVYKDGSVGPLYFIRYNRHAGWNESNTPFAFYQTSPDKSFIAICDELMANKLMVQQWWEEDRSQDGFYLMGGEGFKCKAFNWYTRKDGMVVGLFKAAYSAYSKDGGKTWSDIHKIPSIIVGHAKMWGQQTEDGKYALVYNPHFEWRYPLVVDISDDGKSFSNMACVHGELPPMRYDGDAKDVGPQYIRGITVGNGNPPGKDMWLTYSMSKEDIWVSRVPTPIRHKVDKWVRESFDEMETGGVVTDWNIYSSLWGPVNVADFPGKKDKSLMFRDKEPYDYAKAVRVLPESSSVTVQFDMLAEQVDNGRMEIELLSRKGNRPVRIIVGDNGKIAAIDGEKVVEAASYEAGKWSKFKITADVKKGKYDLSVNGKKVVKNAAFAERAKELQRVSFRTGRYRKLGIGKDENAGDLPNAGDAVKEAVYYLNNVTINP